MPLSQIWLYTLVSVFIVSSISLIGLITLSADIKKLKIFLIYFISFSAGALFGDVFIHLLPEVVKEDSFTFNISIYILSGIVLFFVLEKFIHWRHCHMEITEENHIHPFVYTNLIGDGLHNFLDGIIIAVSYMASIPAGIATTIAVALHEIPQEIGDFGVLLHGGFSKGRALLLNFASALLAVIGATAVFLLGSRIENLSAFLVPIAAGGFIYIAGSDLIPELHKHSDKLGSSFVQLLAFVAGIVIMIALLLI